MGAERGVIAGLRPRKLLTLLLLPIRLLLPLLLLLLPDPERAGLAVAAATRHSALRARCRRRRPLASGVRLPRASACLGDSSDRPPPPPPPRTHGVPGIDEFASASADASNERNPIMSAMPMHREGAGSSYAARADKTAAPTARAAASGARKTTCSLIKSTACRILVAGAASDANADSTLGALVVVVVVVVVVVIVAVVAAVAAPHALESGAHCSCACGQCSVCASAFTGDALPCPRAPLSSRITTTVARAASSMRRSESACAPSGRCR